MSSASNLYHCDCTRYCKGINTVVSHTTYKRHRDDRLGLGREQFSAEFTKFLAEMAARNLAIPPAPHEEESESESQKRARHDQETEFQSAGTRGKRRRTEPQTLPKEDDGIPV